MMSPCFRWTGVPDALRYERGCACTWVWMYIGAGRRSYRQVEDRQARFVYGTLSVLQVVPQCVHFIVVVFQGRGPAIPVVF